MENKKNITIKRVIQRCGCDKVLPLALVYILYVILHGHLSPGGGFQGGILTVAAVLLVYLGHGYINTKKAFVPNLLHPLEGVALTMFIVIAFLGILYGVNFAGNFLYSGSEIGALYSSGTVFWMGLCVAFDVICGAGVLTIGVLSILFPQDIDSLEADKQEKAVQEANTGDDSLEM